MMYILVAILFTCIGFIIGRGSVRMTVGGKIIPEVDEDGRTIFSLEVDTDIDELPNKKLVIFKVQPMKPTLF